MSNKIKLLIISGFIYFISGGLYFFFKSNISIDLLDKLLLFSLLFFFLCWLFLDTLETDSSFGRVVITSAVLLIPLFWYLFTTRKAKESFLLLGKALVIPVGYAFLFYLPTLVINIFIGLSTITGELFQLIL